MHKITKLRIGEIKKQCYDEYIKRCSQINSEAEKAGCFRGGRLKWTGLSRPFITIL